MKRIKRIALFVLVSWAGYVLAGLVLSWAMNHEFQLAKSLILGLLMAGIMALAMTRMRSDKEIIAYVPMAELKEHVEWTDLEVVRQHLQDRDKTFRKANVSATPEGLKFRFSRLFGWLSYTLVVMPLNDGVHIHGDDSDLIFSGEDHYIRHKVLVARHLMAKGLT